jgi:hypothetical protein
MTHSEAMRQVTARLNHFERKERIQEHDRTPTHKPTISPQTLEATKGDRIPDHAKDRGLETKFAILPDNT